MGKEENDELKLIWTLAYMLCIYNKIIHDIAVKEADAAMDAFKKRFK